jgi:hypothetical protein
MGVTTGPAALWAHLAPEWQAARYVALAFAHRTFHGFSVDVSEGERPRALPSIAAVTHFWVAGVRHQPYPDMRVRATTPFAAGNRCHLQA